MEIVSYDRDTGIFLWKNDIRKGKGGRILIKRAGSVAGIPVKSGNNTYLQITIYYVNYAAHRLAWLYEYGEWPPIVDHRNIDGTDNRIKNIRPCSESQNLQNSRRYSNNSSGVKGVSFNKASGKFVASVTKDGRRHHLGFFSSLEDAAVARVARATELHGEFARQE